MSPIFIAFTIFFLFFLVLFKYLLYLCTKIEDYGNIQFENKG